jgi:integrating conjugative element relaxase (TIGR03760 family)
MLSLFQRKRAPFAAAPSPAPATDRPKGLMRPESAASLLATPRRQRLLEHIWQRTSLSRKQFAALYHAPLERYAELVQAFPASEAHHHAYPGGMLDHGLEIVAYSLKLRQSHLLPIGASPEDQAAQSEAWTAAVAYAALLHDIGKIAVDLHVELADGSVWHPWHGPLHQPYRFRYREDREYRLHSAATGLLYRQLLDCDLLDWLSGYPSLWAPMLYVLAGQYEHAGMLGELVVQADRASVAQELGGDPARAMATPKHALQRKLLDGLRYLLKEELKLNQPEASDGWLTEDTLWLVSKTVSDKLRAHLLSQGTHTMVAGPDSLVLRTSLALRAENGVLSSQFTVKDGETVSAVLGYSPSYQESPAVIDADRSFQRTKAFWQGWSMRGAEAGPWTTVVRRSLLTLKALTFHPTGGIVAAPTTSLPEFLGGERNWDYRYCWLRDATFTLLAFLNGGYEEEADLWREWLLKAVAGRPEQIQIMYGLRGERRLDEWTVPWLSGYRKSSPVRVGNMAAKQTQLDIYGELSHAMAVAAMGGLPPPARGLTLRTALLVHLEKVWKEPDAGIWEIRGDPRHFVHSKVMAWVSFDRAATSNYLDGDGPKQKHYRRVADRIHADICKNGVDPKRQCFVQSYGSTEIDASALLFAIVGFLPPDDERVVNTVREVEERLVHDGFVMRYETDSGIDGLPPGEGAFLACSFWLVDIYVLQGRYEDAQRLFESLISLTNDVGLLAEEYDPRAKRQLGNFPQAFSHVALVNSAFALHRATSKAESGRQDNVSRSPPHIKPNRA